MGGANAGDGFVNQLLDLSLDGLEVVTRSRTLAWRPSVVCKRWTWTLLRQQPTQHLCSSGFPGSRGSFSFVWFEAVPGGPKTQNANPYPLNHDRGSRNLCNFAFLFVVRRGRSMGIIGVWLCGLEGGLGPPLKEQYNLPGLPETWQTKQDKNNDELRNPLRGAGTKEGCWAQFWGGACFLALNRGAH